MEKILPVAGATGVHSFAPTEANPPLPIDQLEDSDYGTPQAQPPAPDDMDVDGVNPISESVPPQAAVSAISAVTSTTSSFTVAIPSADDISLQPAAKRQRLPQDKKISKTKSSGALSAPHATDSKRSMGKGKGKARTSSDNPSRSARSESFPAQAQSSTLQRVNKVTPAVALVELHGSIKDMTQAILVASTPPESTGEKAMTRCHEAVRLVQERDDGLSVMEKARLIVFFGNHNSEADIYTTLEDDQLRRAVIKQWIGDI